MQCTPTSTTCNFSNQGGLANQTAGAHRGMGQQPLVGGVSNALHAVRVAQKFLHHRLQVRVIRLHLRKAWEWSGAVDASNTAQHKVQLAGAGRNWIVHLRRRLTNGYCRAVRAACLPMVPVAAGVQHILRRPWVQEGWDGRDELHLHAGHADFVDVGVALQHAGQRLDQHCAADDRLIVLAARLRLAAFEKKAGGFSVKSPNATIGPMLRKQCRMCMAVLSREQRTAKSKLSAPSFQHPACSSNKGRTPED